jgi:hypothetical protein
VQFPSSNASSYFFIYLLSIFLFLLTLGFHLLMYVVVIQEVQLLKGCKQQGIARGNVKITTFERWKALAKGGGLC